MRSILGKAKHELVNHNRNIKSGLPNTTSIHFLTFANTDYMPPDRIMTEAREFGFETRVALNETHIPEVIERHGDFIQDNPQGFGLWIWKPTIILQRLQEIPENDVLLYCDAGMHLNRHGLRCYYEYLSKLNTYNMVVFSLPDVYKAQTYVKRDAVNAYFPEFAYQLDPYHYAGFMLLKNTPITRQVIREWRELCEDEHFLDRSDSIAENVETFGGNDCDNGLWNLCLAKHPSTFFAVSPFETNLYDAQGLQYYQKTTEKEWAGLQLFPFQVRRMRPPFD